MPPCTVGGVLCVPPPPLPTSAFLVVHGGQDCCGSGVGPAVRMHPCLVVSWRLELAAINGHSLETLMNHGLQNVDILILSLHLHLLARIPWEEKLPLNNYDSRLATLDCRLFRKYRGYA